MVLAADTLSKRLRDRYTAILLAGAAARGEHTVDPSGRLASDLDFLVVLPQRHPVTALLAEHTCRNLLRGYETELPDSLKGVVSVGFVGSSPRIWRLATPFMYELRANARCLHGFAGVLDWPQIADPTHIPPWEGVRLVVNRLCELFDAVSKYSEGRLDRYPYTTDEQDHLIPAAIVRYAAIKQILACSEAALLLAGAYRPTYSERATAHQHVSHLFDPGQNALIDGSYAAKLGAKSSALGSPHESPYMLVSEAIALALHMLSIAGAETPSLVAHVARHVTPAAPGMVADLLFFVTQAGRGRRVPLRRPISAVYHDAVALAWRIALEQSQNERPYSGIYPLLAAQLTDLYKRFTFTPQVVGVISPGKKQ
jgi:hypothetical protein